MVFLDSNYNAIYNEWMISLLNSDTTDSLISGITWGVVAIAGSLAAAFFLFSAGWHFITSAVSGGPNTFKLSEFGRMLSLLFAISIFPAIMSIPSYIADVLRISTSKLVSEENISKYEEYVAMRSNFDDNILKMSDKNKYNTQAGPNDKQKEQIKNGQKTDYKQNTTNNTAPVASDIPAKEDESIWDNFANLLGIQSFLSMCISTIIFIICQILKLCILAFCVSGSKIMLCIGPLALAFSIIPWWKDKVLDWFNFYCTLLFVPVILNIIDAIVLHHLFSHISVSGNTNAAQTSGDLTGLQANIIASTALDLAIVFLYIGAFTITSKVVGSSDPGRIFSDGVNKVLQAGTMVATGGASIGQAFGSLSGNIASTGKSALEK